MISEEELLTVYRDTIRPLYVFVARRARSGSRALVEDVVQETYLRAVRHWRRNGFPHNPLAWLQTVAANLVASHYRRRPTESLEQLDVDPADRSAKSLDACDTGFIRKGLSGIENDQARLLEAFHVEEKSTREIAGELGISERAVEGRLRRARLALRHRLLRLITGG